MQFSPKCNPARGASSSAWYIVTTVTIVSAGLLYFYVYDVFKVLDFGL